jgi:hypothetical protein
VALWVAAGVPLAAGAVAGLALSFGNIVATVTPIVGPGLAVAFPLVWDVILLGAAIAYLATAYAGRPRVMWRVISLVGVAGTVAVNASAAVDVRSLVVHISGPVAWGVLVEAAATQLRTTRHATGAEVGADQVIPVRLWASAPIESARVWLRLARRLSGEQAAARAEVGAHTAAIEALRLALPGRAGRRVRRIITRQIRTGALSPADALRACHPGGGGPVAPGVVLRAALTHTLANGSGTGHAPAGEGTYPSSPADPDTTAAHDVSAAALTPATSPAPVSAAVSRSRGRKARPTRSRSTVRAVATDEDLLSRLDAAVAAGDLTPDQVTASRTRALMGVGAGRADRLARTWQNTRDQTRGDVRREPVEATTP